MYRKGTNTVFFGPMVGELGWACSRWHAWCRYRRFVEFPNHRSIAADYDWRYPLYADFIDEFIPLPDWFTSLGLEQDCYEAVQPGAQAGSLTPYHVYVQLNDHFKQVYNPDTTFVVRPPRGCNFIVQERAKQMWKTLQPSPNAKAYVDSILAGNKLPVIVLSGRKRARADNRNVPEFVWDKVVDELCKHFTVVITGTKHSSALVTKTGRNIINIIPNVGQDGLDILIAFLEQAMFSVTSQSGPTLISLLCETPSYMIGHEADRHSKTENVLNAPTMFRTVPNFVYAAVTPETILNDVYSFYNSISHANAVADQFYTASYTDARHTMKSLLVDDVQLVSVPVEPMRQEIIYGQQQ